MANEAGNTTGGTPPVTPPATGATGGTPIVGGTGAGGTPPGAQGGGAATPPSWYSAFSDENRGVVELKGFKTAEDVLNSYRNAEKFIGTPTERRMLLPEKLDDDKALAPIYDRLGRPEKAEGYALKALPETDPEFVKWAQGQFHAAGLSKRQGEALFKNWSDHVSGLASKQQESQTAALQQQESKLKEEWGSAFDQNTGIARKFASAVGFDDNDCRALAGVLGVDGLNKFFVGIVEKFGIQLGEHDFHGGEGGQGNNFKGPTLSPGAAGARMKELQGDTEWTKKFLSGDVAAREEFDRLSRWKLGME